MSKKMLIDATHPEETRVVVVENGKLEELDVDTSTKKQIKGNIYLAKVVRVEPSLQAAFVDYGGNRHGFLAFAEIHPDYYQIPVADREELKKQMEVKEEAAEEEIADTNRDGSEVEVVSESETEDVTRTRPNFFKKYKIQEVVRHGQVMLVQVVKEERGNKGAALTTYLSLAGRYSVLMPNNGKGGGVSRKITNVKERKSLRTIVDKLPIPAGMSVIIRTAGQGKTKSEIKRDYDYLIKTWMQIREMTLESIAPKLIHQEGDIIKRSLRDVFTPDIDEIWVEGEKVFKYTRDFMKMLIPSQAKKIKQYKGNLPLFQEMQVESQLEEIHNNVVQLKSGGYLVIDQTEALVAVDVNSGRATRERDIEETALRTNLETCEELARQLKLRDMAGLVVIDFIDMDEQRNNLAVERRLKEVLKKDRARIQVGKISGFGLMEMSRQRLHSSFLESSYKKCPYCEGKGLIRSVESSAMHALHLMLEAAVKNEGNTIILTLPVDVAFYLLNHKREALKNAEEKYHVTFQVMGDSTLQRNSDFRLERVRNGEKNAIKEAVRVNTSQPKKKQERPAPAQPTVQETPVQEEGEHKEDSRPNRHRRRRDRWKKKRREQNTAADLMRSGEEKFTIVEQEPLVVFDSHAHKDIVKKEEKLPAKVEEKKQPVATDLDTILPKEKKGGWWNRLVK